MSAKCEALALCDFFLYLCNLECKYLYKYVFLIWKQILKRLNITESYNESMAIQNFVKGHKCKGVIAERAEKVFLTHMEIIRLKYPGTLQKLHEDSLVCTLHIS